MLSIVYSSRASDDFPSTELPRLLEQSRANNERLGLTGMLLFRSGYFLQVLEGEEEVVRSRMRVIGEDDRHSAIRVLIDETISERLFPDWTMAYHSAAPEETGEVPGLRATFDDLESRSGGGATLTSLRALIAWYRRQA